MIPRGSELFRVLPKSSEPPATAGESVPTRGRYTTGQGRDGSGRLSELAGGPPARRRRSERAEAPPKRQEGQHAPFPGASPTESDRAPRTCAEQLTSDGQRVTFGGQDTSHGPAELDTPAGPSFCRGPAPGVNRSAVDKPSPWRLAGGLHRRSARGGHSGNPESSLRPGGTLGPPLGPFGARPPGGLSGWALRALGTRGPGINELGPPPFFSGEWPERRALPLPRPGRESTERVRRAGATRGAAETTPRLAVQSRRPWPAGPLRASLLASRDVVSSAPLAPVCLDDSVPIVRPSSHIVRRSTPRLGKVSTKLPEPRGFLCALSKTAVVPDADRPVPAPPAAADEREHDGPADSRSGLGA